MHENQWKPSNPQSACNPGIVAKHVAKDTTNHLTSGQPASPRTSHRPKIWFVVRKNRRMAFSKCCWVNFGHHGYLFGPWKWFFSTATNPKIFGSSHTMFFDDLGIQNQQKKHLGIWPQASFIQNVISVLFFSSRNTIQRMAPMSELLRLSLLLVQLLTCDASEEWSRALFFWICLYSIKRICLRGTERGRGNLPPRSIEVPLEKAPSGHLVIPVDDYAPAKSNKGGLSDTTLQLAAIPTRATSPPVNSTSVETSPARIHHDM